MQGLGNFLARLGGADPDVLARAKQITKVGAAKDKAKFVALGLVLLASASLAVLSMTFAMTDGLHATIGPAIALGVMWGAIILAVDRALILSLKPKGSRWLLFLMIMPRVLMAALLGLVISTPLTLRIFNDEIEHQMAIDNIKRVEAASALLTDAARQLNIVKDDIAKYEGYLSGNVPVTSTKLTAAENEYKLAEADYHAKQVVAEKAYAAWRCELDGQLCETGSGKVGNGPRAKALKLEYDRKQGDANDAQALLRDKQNALEVARQESKDQSAGKVVEAQAEANRVLPGLRKQRDDLQKALQGDLGTSNEEAANDNGLLARLVALSNLGEANGWARLAHLLVAALFFMLELLPVAVRCLSILGPPTAYDQVDELDTIEVVRAAGRQEYIDRDLEKRKKRIAETVHDEVEAVMRELALDQVNKWKAEVELALHGPPLINYDGWVNLKAGYSSSVTVWSAQRRLTLDVPRAFEVTVTIAPDDCGEISERLVVTGGRDAPEVEFTVEVDSDRAALRRSAVPLRVDLPHGIAACKFEFDFSETMSGTTPWIWFRVSQARRTLQNVELTIEVAPPVTTTASVTSTPDRPIR